jgi:hypothetical protein
MKNSLLILTLTTFIVSGCAGGTSRIKLMKSDADAGTVNPALEKVRGESCRRSILFVISLEKDGTLNDAVDNALEKAQGANALADMKIQEKRLMTVLYNYRCIEVEGRPVAMK